MTSLWLLEWIRGTMHARANLKVQQQANLVSFFLEVVLYLVTGTSNCSCKNEVGLLIHFHTNKIKKTLMIVSNHLIILCQLRSFLYYLMLWWFRGHWLCAIKIIWVHAISFGDGSAVKLSLLNPLRWPVSATPSAYCTPCWDSSPLSSSTLT